MSVIIFHLDAAWLPGGFAGVDVFFVISGFVVSASVHKMAPSGIGAFVAHFYARRVVRIIPALVVCLLVTALASAAFIPSAFLSDANQRTGQAAFFGLSNLVLARRSGDYWSPRAEFNPYTHTWSLGVEEQFYLLFPLMFFAWVWSRRRLSMALFGVAAVCSLIVAVWLAQVSPVYAFYMIMSRFWELAAGVLLFQWMAARGHSFERASPPSRAVDAAAIVSALLLLGGLALAPAGKAPMPASIVPVIGTLGVLGFVHGRDTGLIQRILSLNWLRFIGKISYSLYLWHWPVFVLFRWTVGLKSLPAQGAAVALTLLLAAASFHLIEKPTRKAGSAAPRRVALGAGLALLFAGFATVLVVDRAHFSISLSTVAKHRANWYGDWEFANAGGGDCRGQARAEAFYGGSRWELSRAGGCTDAANARNIFVIGDSHSGAYVRMVTGAVKELGGKGVLFTRGGCPFLSLLARDEESGCIEFTKEALEQIEKQVRPGDLIFLPSLRLPRFTDVGAEPDEDGMLAEMSKDKTKAARSEAERTAAPVLRRFTDRGAFVVLEAPKPVLKVDPYRCGDWFNASNEQCQPGASVSREFILRLRAPVLASFDRIRDGNSRVVIWDPLPVLCPGPACSAYSDQRPLFFDGDHVSGYSNDLLARDFARFARELPAN